MARSTSSSSAHGSARSITAGTGRAIDAGSSGWPHSPASRFSTSGALAPPTPAPPRSVTLEDWVNNTRTVMDAAGFARPAVVTWTDATVVGLSLAATFPERTRALAIVNWSYDLFTSTLELTSGFPEWGGDEMLSRLPALAPSDANNPTFQDWFLRTQRASAGPGAVAAMYAMLRELDVEAIIPLVSVPTIVVRRTAPAIVGRAGQRACASDAGCEVRRGSRTRHPLLGRRRRLADR